MYENKFDEALDEVSCVNDLNWSDDAKIRLFARFLGARSHLFREWKNFLENQAIEELTAGSATED